MHQHPCDKEPLLRRKTFNEVDLHLPTGFRIWDRFHNPSFSLNLTNWPNKLECLSLAQCNVTLESYNTNFAYWAHL